MTFSRLCEKNYILFDGAMGTELQKRGLKAGEPPESLNFTAPEKVREVIRAYAESGSDIVTANTFGANRYKLSETGKTVGETVSRALEAAREAVGDFPDILIAQDVGPAGRLLRPAGTLGFDEAYEMFAEQIKAGVNGGADLFVLQTFSDLLELKCALLAVKENSRLPAICSMTFEANGRTFTGCPASAFALTASGLGADVIGVNCSLDPRELLPVVREFRKYTDLPIMAKPNAGLPDPVTGAYGLSAEDFAADMREHASAGVKILGGCCGTSPEYIRLLKETVDSVNYPEFTERKKISAVCSGVKTVVIDRPRVVGERINPTGKRAFKEALKNSDVDYILGRALEQVKAGADILDVNVGLPETDEKAMMLRVIEPLQGVCDLPLQIDGTDPDVIEAALRRCGGKPIVNSVNGKEESLSSVLPLVKKYGAAVIGLTLDEKGVPETAEERFEIAKYILDRALSLGIRKEDVFIDCLTLTVSTEAGAAVTALNAVKMVKDRLGLKTALGVSNVSFGLPERDVINAAFLTAALNGGLDLPIINPNSPAVMGAVRAYNLLNGYDKNAAEYISAYSGKAAETAASGNKELTLSEAVLNGMKKDGALITARLLENIPAMDVIDGHLIPALDKAGDGFESGLIFLPQLILSAETAGACFDVIKKKINSKGERAAPKSKGKIILATVKGDIHDIGKNIVKVLLENYGYEIIDLGKDVPPETAADAAASTGAGLVGLSALMTTTTPAMAETVALIKERGLRCAVMVGGAVLNADYALSSPSSGGIGADYYAKDAKGAVDIAKKVFGEKVEK
ncbi:MAG: homocysteine S-methyltransferase family protein [Oscillospiraceae bacterium]|jgi:5-methyltetrahydrofolate--homocysteine methyltransferase|nr:homocysteine S-methyltransferase family protein [Oscillospiraceae bacterium]